MHRNSLSGHAGSIYALAWWQERGLVLSGSGDGFVAGWDVSREIPANFSVNVGKPVFSLALSPQEDTLCVGQAAGGIHVINLQEKREEHLLQIHQKGVYHVVFDSAQPLWYSAGGDGSVAVWRQLTCELVVQVRVTHGKVRRLSLSHCGKWLACATSTGEVVILETQFFNEVTRFDAHEGGAYALLWDVKRRWLATGGKDAHLRFWQPEFDAHPAQQLLAIPAHNFAIYDLLVTPDNAYLISASRDKTFKIWPLPQLSDPLRVERRTHPQGHTHSVNALLWVEENTLVTAGDDRKLRLWRMEVAV